MKIDGHEIPGLLLDAIRDGVLPTGRIRSAVQALPQPSAGHFAETDLELIRTPDVLQLGRSQLADTASLRRLTDSNELAEKYKKPPEVEWRKLAPSMSDSLKCSESPSSGCRWRKNVRALFMLRSG